MNLAHQGNSGSANEPLSKRTQPDSRWGENKRATGMETPTNPDATQSSSVEPYPWREGKFEPTWGTWWTQPAPDPPYDASWGKATQRWDRTERERKLSPVAAHHHRNLNRRPTCFMITAINVYRIATVRTLAVYCYSSTAVQLAVHFFCCFCRLDK